MDLSANPAVSIIESCNISCSRHILANNKSLDREMISFGGLWPLAPETTFDWLTACWAKIFHTPFVQLEEPLSNAGHVEVVAPPPPYRFDALTYQVHEMLDIHAAPTVLLYMSGQLVDEFVCGGDNGSKTLLRHVEAQIGPEPPRP